MIPPLFLAHGSPMLAIEETDYTRFLEGLGRRIKPKAIVVFSAHWEQDTIAVTATDGVYETIYDFYGFPPELYAVSYPAKGSKTLAASIAGRFGKQGIEVRLDESRGLDHGSWTLLYRMYPQADIPVVQISVNPYLAPKEQVAIGRALQGLVQEDILVIGSGVTVHNLRMVHWDQTEPEPWAVAFDDWLIGRLEDKDLDALNRYEELAPYARQAVPRAEHFVPLFLAMGSAEPQAKPQVLHRSYQFGTLSYLSFQFA